jgi:hypothetical protein
MLHLQKEDQDQLDQDLEPRLLGPAKYKIRLNYDSNKDHINSD